MGRQVRFKIAQARGDPVLGGMFWQMQAVQVVSNATACE